MGMVTLKDIAKACNISYSAVSKALKGSSEIGTDTITLVRETALKMGYHPNAAARALRTNRSYDIGVVFEDSTGSGLQHQYFATIFDSLNVTANIFGYDITFLNSENKNNRNYYAQAKYRGCDGVAIVSTDFCRADIRELLASDIPVCTLDFFPGGNHSAVISDNTQGITRLTEMIISQGHEKIAFIHGEPSSVTRIRISAFRTVMQNHLLPVPDNYIIQGIYHDPHVSANATHQLLEEKNPPTCILYPDDFACLGGIKVMETMKLKPGRDISIAGYDGILLASLLSPALATYEQNGKELGKQLAVQLIRQIENPDSYTPSIISVSGRLIPGNSVVPIHVV